MPHVRGDLTYANADLKTYYGTVSSHLKIDNDKLLFDVEIPANTKATIYIPTNPTESITEGSISLSSVKEIRFVRKEGNYIVVEVGSGKYHFSSAR